MRIEYLLIRNFKSIRELEINDIEDVLILVGRNNAGKSVVLDAIRAVTVMLILPSLSLKSLNETA